MKSYTLNRAPGFTQAAWENHVSKAFDVLKGICQGVLADGIVNEQESCFLRDWLETNRDVHSLWPFTDIVARVRRIFADGIVTAEERDELKTILLAITGTAEGETPIADTSTGLPLDTPPPARIEFLGSEFCVTGKFAFGTRDAVVTAIASAGGTFNSAPRQATRYLVIGHFASRDWIHSAYGRKIERAVELRDAASGIGIIGEEFWRTQLPPANSVA